MNRIFYFLISFVFICSPELRAQELYPGDVNNNGEVNVVDALFVGVAYGTTGPIRNNASISWVAQDISTTLWAESFQNGINYAYADTDGNGLIDKDDIKDAIKDNYGLTHGTVTPDVFASGVVGTDPALRLQNISGIGQLGGTMEIDIDLGDSNLPMNDFYGIAFSIEYDNDIIEEIDFVEDATSWINPVGDDIHELAVENTVTGTYDIVITRKDQNPISGFGKLGSLNIVIEDIVAMVSSDTMTQLKITKVKMVTPEMTELPIVKDSITLTIDNVNALNYINPSNQELLINIHPNPIKESFVVESYSGNLQSVRLYNLLGENISLMQGLESDKITYPLNNIPSGCYYLLIETKLGIASKKIIIH